MEGYFRDAENAVLASMTEQEMAMWLKAQGKTIIYNNGRYWTTHPKGFYRSIHWMARMDSIEARRPSSFCWGFRTALQADEVQISNSTIPVNLLRDLDQYGLQSLRPRQRTKIRGCLKKVCMVEVLKPDPIVADGYSVYLSAYNRHGYGPLLSRKEFARNIEHYFNPRRGLLVAGLIDGQIAGFMEAEAVEGTAYVKSVHLDSNALSTQIGQGLLFELLQVFKRSEGIHQVVHGLHTIENKGLTEHKTGMGFSVTQVPARIWFAPMTGSAIRLLRPHTYYRLTGQELA